jgi:hypothetical protein
VQLGLFLELADQIKNGDSKECVKCKRVLPLSSFSNASGGNYLRSECRSCANTLSETRKRLRDTVAPPPENYTCPICGKDAGSVDGYGGKSAGSWALDHDHTTENFRGWLCHKCNRALGAFEDDPERMKAAIVYLQERSDNGSTETKD